MDQNFNGKFRTLKIEVLYYIKPYFGCISPYIALTKDLVGNYLQFRYLKWRKLACHPPKYHRLCHELGIRKLAGIVPILLLEQYFKQLHILATWKWRCCFHVDSFLGGRGYFVLTMNSFSGHPNCTAENMGSSATSSVSKRQSRVCG